MKASELRIGNIIQTHSGVIGKVVSIGSEEQEFEQVYCECDESYEWFFKDNYFGVPLTEDWLLKLGFTKEYAFEEWFYEKYFDGMDSIRVLQSDFSVGTYVNQKIAHAPQPSIMFLHQLQNLYFALTNEELTYEQQK